MFRLGCFSAKLKEFADLAGCSWAYNDELSLSGNKAVLAELKRRGFNASFFGNVVCSGQHSQFQPHGVGCANAVQPWICASFLLWEFSLIAKADPVTVSGRVAESQKRTSRKHNAD